MFECIPINALWDIDVHGKCIPRSAITVVSYCNTAINMITDAIFAIIPMYFVWNLSIDKKNKISTGFVLSLGLSTSVTNLARITYIHEFQSKGNIPYKVYPICLTSTLEIAFGIIATSLATIRPLIRRLAEQKLASTNSIWKSQQSVHRSDLDPDLESSNTHYSGNIDRIVSMPTNRNDTDADIGLIDGVIVERSDIEALKATRSSSRTNAAGNTDTSEDGIMRRGSLSKANGSWQNWEDTRFTGFE